MFYPQISAYEIHPLIINQRRRSALDKSGLDSDLTGSSDDSVPLGLVTSQHSLGGSPTPLPLSLRHLYKVKKFFCIRSANITLTEYRGCNKCLIFQDTSVAQKQRNVKRKVQVRDLDLNHDDCDDLYSGSDLAGSSQQDSEATDYSSKARKSFFCRACGKSFKFQTSLLRHNNKVILHEELIGGRDTVSYILVFVSLICYLLFSCRCTSANINVLPATECFPDKLIWMFTPQNKAAHVS